jgi:N-methylhydantoinase A
LLGGEFPIDEGLARLAFVQLAFDMSEAAGRKVTTIEAAQGVLTIANTNMERALRQISVERGYDSREFVLLPFGGAGGLHAVELAQSLHIPRIIVPNSAGALSAIGVLTADVVKDQSRTIMLELSGGVEKKLETAFKEMEREARIALRHEGFPETKQRHDRALALRYKGQSFELEIKKTSGDVAANFHRAHKERYGYAQASNIVEVVTARVRSTGIVEKFKQKRSSVPRKKGYARAAKYVTTYLAGRKVRTAVYNRDRLAPGSKLRAPSIVTEYSSTTLIPPGVRASVDGFRNLIIQLE